MADKPGRKGKPSKDLQNETAGGARVVQLRFIHRRPGKRNLDAETSEFRTRFENIVPEIERQAWQRAAKLGFPQSWAEFNVWYALRKGPPKRQASALHSLFLFIVRIQADIETGRLADAACSMYTVGRLAAMLKLNVDIESGADVPKEDLHAHNFTMEMEARKKKLGTEQIHARLKEKADEIRAKPGRSRLSDRSIAEIMAQDPDTPKTATGKSYKADTIRRILARR